MCFIYFTLILKAESIDNAPMAADSDNVVPVMTIPAKMLTVTSSMREQQK